jgi:hypothetical protein
MAARLDHITVVAPSLEAGAAYVEAALGVVPGAGRTHPGMATHNLLLALGPDVYLEVISADPGAVPVRRPRFKTVSFFEGYVYGILHPPRSSPCSAT